MPFQEITSNINYQAIQERKCAWTCAGRAMEKLVEGDLDEAERCAQDLLKSVQELKKLKAKEQTSQRFKAFVLEMKREGINIEKVVRK
ncbi:hypothetical protein K7T73_13150 [Bacillus badius]|uniref:hypothetical protein n=1 Tax=Bacillus badius TaxID=1455 RepID=UPI001CC0A374|nr:hypothetical protein [Bacillus badius]UAT29546.1 hypothetical protein K7T73_13150 [Bacillus badius]